MNNCENCFHKKENHQEGSFCTGDLTCMCQKFIEPFLNEMAQEIELYKHNAKTIRDRCKFLLEKYPHLRNATEKTFCKVYKSIWYGFWPSKKTIYDNEKFKRMPHDDSINREKRRIKAKDLPTIDDIILEHQQRKFEAYMELAIEK